MLSGDSIARLARLSKQLPEFHLYPVRVMCERPSENERTRLLHDFREVRERERRRGHLHMHDSHNIPGCTTWTMHYDDRKESKTEHMERGREQQAE